MRTSSALTVPDTDEVELLTMSIRKQSSLPAVYGRNMQAKGKMALPRGRKKWSQETSLSVLKRHVCNMRTSQKYTLMCTDTCMHNFGLKVRMNSSCR